MRALSAALGMANVVPAFRHTFYRHRTMAAHVREFWWNEATATTMPNGELATGCDRETIRAYHVMGYARCYWPMDQVEDFVREGWARWQRDQPVWFTDEWIARVPPEFIPTQDE